MLVKKGQIQSETMFHQQTEAALSSMVSLKSQDYWRARWHYQCYLFAKKGQALTASKQKSAAQRSCDDVSYNIVTF